MGLRVYGGSIVGNAIDDVSTIQNLSKVSALYRVGSVFLLNAASDYLFGVVCRSKLDVDSLRPRGETVYLCWGVSACYLIASCNDQYQKYDEATGAQLETVTPFCLSCGSRDDCALVVAG